MQMKHVENSGPVDLTTWGFDDAKVNLSTIINDAFRATFEDASPSISFPWEWAPCSDGRNGPAVSDPLTIYVSLPLGADEDNEPEWACSIRNELLGMIELHQNPYTKKVEDKEGIFVLVGMIDALRDVANELEAAIDRTAISVKCND